MIHNMYLGRLNKKSLQIPGSNLAQLTSGTSKERGQSTINSPSVAQFPFARLIISDRSRWLSSENRKTGWTSPNQNTTSLVPVEQLIMLRPPMPFTRQHSNVGLLSSPSTLVAQFLRRTAETWRNMSTGCGELNERPRDSLKVLNREKEISVEVNGEHERATPEKSSTFKCGTPYMHQPSKDGHDYWNDLLKPLQAHDKTQCKVWEEEVQNILIFASLFSAVVTAFIVESYKNLKPDPTDAAVVLLMRIAARLDNPVNSSTLSPSLDETPIPFSPSLTLVNVFWILSLVVSLTTVLIGIVSSQWLREHQLYPAHFSTEEKFALFNMRTEMLNRWYIPAFFASLPVLLELALVLFFLGLAEFLRSLGVTQVTAPIIVAIGLSLLFLLATTAIPALQVLTVRSTATQFNKTVPVPCPYKSPQARLFRLAVSSRMGNFLIHHTFSPIYSLFVVSAKYARALRFPSSFPPSFPTLVPESFKRRAFKARALIRLRLDYILGRRRKPRDLFESYQPSYPNYNPVNAHSWTDLDLEWISLRRHYSSQVLVGWHGNREGGGLEKELQFGPLFDHIRGIELACTRHHTVLLSAYHCFVDCISTAPPGQPSLDLASTFYGDDYYKTVVEILRPRGTVLVSDVVPKPQRRTRIYSRDLLYDEAILLFIERFNIPVPERTKTELMLRVLDYVSNNCGHWTPDANGPPKGLPIPQSRMYKTLVKSFFWETPPTDSLVDAPMEYPYSFFRNIANGKMDWSVHQIFLEEFRGILADYLRSSLSAELRHSGLLDRAVSTLNENFRHHWESTRRPGNRVSAPCVEHESAYFLLGSWAIVEAYMLNHRHHADRVPRSVLDLAATTRGVCRNVLAAQAEPFTRAILVSIASVWGREVHFVCRHITFHNRLQDSILGSLLNHADNDNPPEVGLEVSSSTTTDEKDVVKDNQRDSSSRNRERSVSDEYNLAESGFLLK
ncbi:unnamed protein product [Cyclocybe aegerita]|uniref:DUF6535 domain-containing protein n=1 Tax=Cyclocybe aegerita TaxID=1973307 RepID=A0A8S0XIH2_CYCAE|nr:unnamed protein product [Cyclocybe aegerita]